MFIVSILVWEEYLIFGTNYWKTCIVNQRKCDIYQLTTIFITYYNTIAMYHEWSWLSYDIIILLIMAYELNCCYLFSFLVILGLTFDFHIWISFDVYFKNSLNVVFFELKKYHISQICQHKSKQFIRVILIKLNL